MSFTYSESLAKFDTHDYPQQLRTALAAAYPRHGQLDYPALFQTVRQRSAQVWLSEIAPALGKDRSQVFERALSSVQMPAGRSIPWAMGFGYTFGATCQALAGGDSAQRAAAATTSALGNFIIGFYDRLMDVYPQAFGSVGELISDAAITRFTVQRDLSALRYDAEQVLAAGLVEIYRLYYTRCHQLLGESPDAAVVEAWRESLLQTHRAQRNSPSWKISQMAPTPAMIDEVESPGALSNWVLAVSACLGLDMPAMERMQGFAKSYARLCRLVDSIIDIQEDIESDIWGGMTVRLALEAKTQQDADRIVTRVIAECVELLACLHGEATNFSWQAGDPYNLADILWAYLWAWAGGNING